MGRVTALEQVFKVRFYPSRNKSGTHIKEAIITARNHKVAERIANSAFPRVFSVTKAEDEYHKIANDELNTFTNNLMKEIAYPRMSPLAMDEFLWMRRNKRIEYKEKDKNMVDRL